MRFLLLAALLSLAATSQAQPKQAAGQPSNATDQNMAGALNNLTASLQKPAELGKNDEPCVPGDNKRSSDLCAQWKAADAAADSAWWAARATLIGGLSGVLVLIALGFAFQANHIARLTAKQELRPYVVPKGVHWQILNPEKPNGSIVFNVNWENAGRIPAFDLKMAAQAFVKDADEPPTQIDQALCSTPLGPGSTVLTQSMSVSALDIQRAYDGQAFIYLAAIAEYTDGFSPTKRIAKCCYRILTNRSPDKEHSWAATNWVRWSILGPYNGFEGEERA